MKNEAEQGTTEIVVNGVKLEVDLRTARRVDSIKVGTRVKVLRKEYSSHKVDHGIVIGFEPFKKLPTIIVATATMSYSEAKIDFVYYNANSEDVEIVIARDDDKAGLEREQFVSRVEREIEKKQSEIKELENRKDYFLKRFATYWEQPETESNEAATSND